MDGGTVLGDHEVDANVVDATGNGHGIADQVLKPHWSLEVKIRADAVVDRLTNMCPFWCVEGTATEAGDGWRDQLNQLRNAIKTINPILHQLLAIVIEEKWLNNNTRIHIAAIHGWIFAASGCRQPHRCDCLGIFVVDQKPCRALGDLEMSIFVAKCISIPVEKPLALIAEEACGMFL